MEKAIALPSPRPVALLNVDLRLIQFRFDDAAHLFKDGVEVVSCEIVVDMKITMGVESVAALRLGL